MKDKVSIIVPMYNVELYLEKCVESLINQTYSNIEILLIDDCSTDNTGKIAKKLSKQNLICKYIKRKENGGLSAARNTGIVNSTGEYLAFVDSDDWLDKTFIEKMLKQIKKENSDIVVCDYKMVYEDGKEVVVNSLYPLTNESSIEDKIAYIRNHSCTKMFKKNFWEKQNLMFPENIKRGEDMAIVIPLLTKANKISIVDEPLYNYFQRNNSISNLKNNKKIDLSFLDNAVESIINNSNQEYDNEIEYHAILELIYGKTMLMIKHQYTNKDIKLHLKEFNKKFPNWKNNLYIKNMIFLKKVFVKITSLNLINLLRLMVIINEKRK